MCPLADLQGQLELQLKLRDMQSATNNALRFLDSIEDQLKHTQTTAKTLNKEPDKDMMKALEDYIKQINTLEDRLVRRSEGLGFPGKGQVVNKIGDLFFGDRCHKRSSHGLSAPIFSGSATGICRAHG